MNTGATIIEDGYEWIQRAGQLWGTYDTAADYCGMQRVSFPSFVCKHKMATIKHGRRSLVNKAELDRVTGAAPNILDEFGEAA